MNRCSSFMLVLSIACCLCISTALQAQPFLNPIPIPPLITGSTFNLQADSAQHNFNPNQKNDSLNGLIGAYCYNEVGKKDMSYLGPTLVWKRGADLNINITNKLTGHYTTTHWHGLNLPSIMDGGPHEAFKPDSTWQPRFQVIDPVQTVWYHSHLMDSTTEQVILGLAGMIIVEDSEDKLRDKLPHDYNSNDFPIIIQEKAFKVDTITHKVTQQVYGDKPGNGPFTLINGVLNGTLRVPPQMVRFRFLNGSPRKSFQVAITSVLLNKNDSAAFYKSYKSMSLIATDGGYTAKPHTMDSILISPGERMEMVADFSSMKNGDTLYLSNLVGTMPSDVVSGGGNPPRKGTPGAAFLAFIVDSSIHPATPITSLPSELLPYSVDTSNTFKHRTKNLMGMASSDSNWTIDGTGMDMEVINDTILVNAKEIWTINNTTNVAHPFHIHKVQVQVIQYIMRNGSTADTMSYWKGNLPVYLQGYKDDILIHAGASMSFVTSFNDFPDMMIDPMNGFMYHCHILTHEDHEMMHQFVVIDSMTYFATVDVKEPLQLGSLSVYPNPARETITLRGSSTNNGILRIRDVLGRLLF